MGLSRAEQKIVDTLREGDILQKLDDYKDVYFFHYSLDDVAAEDVRSLQKKNILSADLKLIEND